MGHSLNRRAAIIGAVLSAGALAVPVSAAVRPTTLQALAEKFRDDAMALDPTITNCWVNFDELRDGPRADRVMGIYLERDTAPFVRRPNKGDDLTAKWWKEFSSLSTEQKVTYAGIIRRTDPRFGELADRIEAYYG